MQPSPATVARKPWSPTTVAVLTLVFSPLSGGVLHALNYGRLGQDGLRGFTLARNLLAATLLLIFLGVTMPQFGSQLGATFLFASYFYKSQEDPFRQHLAQGGKKGSVLMAVLVSLLVSIPAAILLLISAR